MSMSMSMSMSMCMCARVPWCEVSQAVPVPA